MRRKLYGHFADTRLALVRSHVSSPRASDLSRRFWFSDLPLYTTLLLLMSAHYNPGRRPGVALSDVFEEMPCSTSTAQRQIERAIASGYARTVHAEDDRRAKRLVPTQRTITMWEQYVDDVTDILRENGGGALLSDYLTSDN